MGAKIKTLFLCLALSSPLMCGELHDTTITLRMNGDYETIDLSQQNPETRRILYKLAYKQYLSYNTWACFKAALLACSITTAAALGAVWYASK